MRLVVCLFAGVFTFASCATQKSVTKDDINSAVQDEHNARNSLDFEGVYRGTLPCADCEGIKTTVYLQKDGTYKLINEYLAEADKPFITTGEYSWDQTGNIVMLKDKDNTTNFKVGENSLIQLDSERKPVTGELAKYYILTKDNFALLNKKWKMTELEGKAISKEFIIQFDDTNNVFSMKTDCNTLSSSFTTESYNHITFGNVITTLMACPEMDVENGMKNVLKTVDAFQINGDELMFFKGRMAPMVKFKLLKD